MAIRVDMSSNDIDRQIQLLKFYPEVVEKHFKSALKRAVKLAEDEIRPNIPVRTGTARDTFKSRVTGKGIDLQGQIGWWGKSKAWYINIVEYGAKPHKIVAKDGGFLGFGSTVVRSVNHPGFSKRGFLAAGYAAVQATIDADMLIASEGVVNEMAVK
jgi:hypothetical protein